MRKLCISALVTKCQDSRCEILTNKRYRDLDSARVVKACEPKHAQRALWEQQQRRVSHA